MRMSFGVCFRFLLLAASLATCGCYPQRWTGNYLQFPDISELQSGIVDESGMSELDKKRRRDYLIAIANEPEPEYLINAGDELRITVYNNSDLSQQVLVTPDGCIGFVHVGQIKLAGMTPAAAARKLEKALDGFIKAPAVGVSPLRVASETVAIVGGVRSPGVFVIHNGMRLADLYATCGGSACRAFDGHWLDVADLVHSVFRRNGQVIPIDFRRAIEDCDPVDNIKLRKGDYIYIAVRSEKMVCVIGDVARPHKRIWDNNLGLLEILTTSGWTRETYYPWVVIIRGGVADPTMYRVNVDAILTGRAANVMTEAGDVIYIPKDDISEYNVFVRKIMPSFSLLNSITQPIYTIKNFVPTFSTTGATE